MKVVILGGTSGMGREVARILAERGEAIFLLGTHPESLEASADDLTARHPRRDRVGHASCDLEAPEQFGPALEAADAALGGFDTVVLTAALYAPQEELERDRALTRRLLTVNFTNTVLFCEETRARLLARGGGRLVVFSSVAGDRGRKPVALYGASKSGLSTYLEALDHRYHDQGLQVLCVKPGFVRTRMTAGVKAPPFAGEPQAVARRVVRALDQGKALVYAPPIWALVMAVIRRLPRFVMRKLGF